MAYDANATWDKAKGYNADITYQCYLDGSLPVAGIYEKNGSRTESYTPTEFTGHVEFYCAWEDRYKYASAISKTVFNADPPLGVNWRANTMAGTFGSITGTILENSYYSSYYPAFVQNVSISTLGAEGVQIPTVNDPTFQKYTKAQLSVDYKGLGRPGDVNLHETITPKMSMRQLPYWGYYWQSDGSPVLEREAPGLQECEVTIQRQLNGIRNIPDWFLNLSGCVNINNWTDKVTNRSYLAGTLLYIPTNMDRNITMKRDDDDNVWNLSYELTWKPQGWQNHRRPTGMDSMMYNGKKVYMYNEAYFPSLLVDPNQPDMWQFLGDPYTVRLVAPNGERFYIGVRMDGTVAYLGKVVQTGVNVWTLV